VICLDVNRLDKVVGRDLVKVNKGKCEVLPLGKNNHRHQNTLGTTQLEIRSGEIALGVLVDTELTMRQQRRPAASWEEFLQKVEKVSRRSSLLSADETHLDCCVQCWASQNHRGDDGTGASLLRVQVERAGTAQRGEEKAQGGSYPKLMGGMKMREPGSLQWSPVTGPEAMGTHTETQETPPEYQQPLHCESG